MSSDDSGDKLRRSKPLKRVSLGNDREYSYSPFFLGGDGDDVQVEIVRKPSFTRVSIVRSPLHPSRCLHIPHPRKRNRLHESDRKGNSVATETILLGIIISRYVFTTPVHNDMRSGPN